MRFVSDLKYTGCMRKEQETYFVSWLLNFLDVERLTSIPSLDAIFAASSGCEFPLKILMFGILVQPIAADASAERKANFAAKLAVARQVRCVCVYAFACGVASVH